MVSGVPTKLFAASCGGHGANVSGGAVITCKRLGNCVTHGTEDVAHQFDVGADREVILDDTHIAVCS